MIYSELQNLLLYKLVSGDYLKNEVGYRVEILMSELQEKIDARMKASKAFAEIDRITDHQSIYIVRKDGSITRLAIFAASSVLEDRVIVYFRHDFARAYLAACEALK